MVRDLSQEEAFDLCVANSEVRCTSQPQVEARQLIHCGFAECEEVAEIAGRGHASL